MKRSLLILVLLSTALAACTPAPIDDSDAPTSRSGMSVRVDHLTGCQYLVASGITPRMGADGKQLCRSAK